MPSLCSPYYFSSLMHQWNSAQMDQRNIGASYRPRGSDRSKWTNSLECHVSLIFWAVHTIPPSPPKTEDWNSDPCYSPWCTGTCQRLWLAWRCPCVCTCADCCVPDRLWWFEFRLIVIQRGGGRWVHFDRDDTTCELSQLLSKTPWFSTIATR